MKIKKVVFTFTGEVRVPTHGVWYKDLDGDFMQSSGGVRDYEIYTKEETEVEWKPKVNERYYFIDLTSKDLVYSGNYFDCWEYLIPLGLIFPTKELAIQKAKQILEFLKQNKD